MPINVNGLSTILADGIWETTQTTGTGTYSLDGAVTSDSIVYRTFVAGVGSGNPTVYLVRSGSQYEIGIGTAVSGAPATLTRSSILNSSNANAAVSWGVGVKDILIAPVAAVFHSIQAQLDNMLTRVKTTVFTASGTFTTDSDCLFAQVRGVAGGGAGGGATAVSATQGSEGNGGGGGEYAEGLFTAAQLGVSKAVTIGLGGTGVAAGQGNNGGTTSMAGLITMNGGVGGGVIGPSAGDFIQIGGAGGTGGTGGFLRIPGGNGGPAFLRGGFLQYHNSGGTSHLSGSNPHNGVTGDGGAGRLYGGGGMGANNYNAGGARTGGPGAAGGLWIVEYCKA